MLVQFLVELTLTVKVKLFNSPALLAADNVYRFGLSRVSSEMSFESSGDNKSVNVASLEITLCTPVEEESSVVLLGRFEVVVWVLFGVCEEGRILCGGIDEAVDDGSGVGRRVGGLVVTVGFECVEVF